MGSVGYPWQVRRTPTGAVAMMGAAAILAGGWGAGPASEPVRSTVPHSTPSWTSTETGTPNGDRPTGASVPYVAPMSTTTTSTIFVAYRYEELTTTMSE